jgi:hypothetical protein
VNPPERRRNSPRKEGNYFLVRRRNFIQREGETAHLQKEKPLSEKGNITLRGGGMFSRLGRRSFPFLTGETYLLEERNCSIKRIWSFSLRRGETSSPYGEGTYSIERRENVRLRGRETAL